MARSINAYLERIGRTHPEESLEIDPAVADVPEYPLAVERLRAELKRQEEQARQEAEREAERQKQERFRKLYEEMREEGGRLHKKALDLPYGSKYRWEYIDYLDGRMFAPMKKFTIGELSEPFLTYEEFAGQKEWERVEQKKAEITIAEQEHSYKVPVQWKKKPEEQKKAPVVLDAQVQKKSGNSGQTGQKKIVTKQDYERMTGKEKAEWLGISESDVNGSINRFKEKMGKIGIRFDSLMDMTEAFLEVWKSGEQLIERDFYEMGKSR